MKDFELRKIKSFEAMSEETEAFTAQLWVDGKHLADLKNDGQGGCNSVHPIKPFKYKDVEPYTSLEVETQISAMVIEWDETRKKQSKGFFLRKGDLNINAEYFTSKFPKPLSKLKMYGNYSHWVTDRKAHFESLGFTVLNRNL
jgi:hypothetical protein